MLTLLQHSTVWITYVGCQRAAAVQCGWCTYTCIQICSGKVPCGNAVHLLCVESAFVQHFFIVLHFSTCRLSA